MEIKMTISRETQAVQSKNKMQVTKAQQNTATTYGVGHLWVVAIVRNVSWMIVHLLAVIHVGRTISTHHWRVLCERKRQTFLAFHVNAYKVDALWQNNPNTVNRHVDFDLGFRPEIKFNA
jgi:hypothetical protein